MRGTANPCLRTLPHRNGHGRPRPRRLEPSVQASHGWRRGRNPVSTPQEEAERPFHPFRFDHRHAGKVKAWAKGALVLPKLRWSRRPMAKMVTGRTRVAIDQWFPSSKTCSACGHVLDELRLDVREWTCPKCGTHHDRDTNAAVNIEHEGLTQLVPGGAGETMRVEGDAPLLLAGTGQNGRHPVKREPGQLTEPCLEQGEGN
jgi:ribosomal protein L37AE/L43A